MPLIVAIDRFALEKVNAPALFELGAVRVKGLSPSCFVTSANVPNVGVAVSTVRSAVVLAVKKFVVEAWVAVMVEVPACTIVTVLPDMVATEVLPLVYVKLPGLFELGEREKLESP